MELCQDQARHLQGYAVPRLDTRVSLHYELPLNEIVYDFFDALKSRTKGYASSRLRNRSAMCRQSSSSLTILLNGDIVDALSFIVHADKRIHQSA